MYLVIRRLGLFDTPVALILTYQAFTLPFSIFLMKNYFEKLPREVEEAALIDGCSWSRMMVQIVLPIAVPGLIAVSIFSFMTAWSDFVAAVILTSSPAARTVPAVVAGFVNEISTQRTLMVAGGVSAVVPPLLLAFLFQRLIVRGLAQGSTN